MHVSVCERECVRGGVGGEGGADLLTCGSGVLAAQHKGSSGPVNALGTRPPVTAQPRQSEHHLLLVGHGSMVHRRACTTAAVSNDLLCKVHNMLSALICIDLVMSNSLCE